MTQRLLETLDRVLAPFRPERGDAPPVWTGRVRSTELAFYPSMFYAQGAVLVLTLVYVFLSLLGRWLNRRAVAPWLRGFCAVLRGEFALVGVDERAPLVWNGSADACLYASGRRGVDAMIATVRLAPRHDLLQLIGTFLYDALVLPAVPLLRGDSVTLFFRLASPRVHGGTLAVIDKQVLQHVRRGRFDLSFARVADVPNASSARSLDERFAIASESGNITDRWLGEVGARGDAQRARTGLVDALNGAGGRFVESLVFTDQPHVQPAHGAVPEGERAERLELTLRLPRTEADVAACVPVLVAALDMIDALHLTALKRSDVMALRPETHVALRKTRAEVDAALDAAASYEADADAEAAREEARRQQQREKREKLSPAEQARREALSKRRAARKAQQTQARRR